MNRYLLTGLLFFFMTLIPEMGIQIARAQRVPIRTLSPDKQMEQRAASLARLGRTEEAVDLYLELLYKNPRNHNMYFRVANLLQGASNAQTLLQILEDILKTQSSNTRLAAEKGRLLYVLDKKPEAMADWQHLLEGNKKDRFKYTTITNAMLQAGATAEAIQILVESRDNLSDPHAFAYDLARLYAVRRNYDMASKEYIAHLDKNPGMLDHISNQLIKLTENDGAFATFSSNFKQFLARPGDHQVLVLSYSKLLLHQKQYKECVRTVLESDLSNALDDVLRIANDLLAERAWVEAADLYLYISATSSDKKQIGEALLKLASTYEYRLQTQKPYASLSDYFKGNQFLELDIHIPSDQDVSLTRTLKLYDSLQTLLPQTHEAFLASFHVAEIQLMVSGDVDRAIRGFQHVFENARHRDTRLSGGRRLVDAWLVRGDTTRAKEVLDRVVKRLNMDVDDSPIIASRIKILIHQGDIPALQKELLNLSGACSPADPIFNDGLQLMALLDGNGAPDDPLLHDYLKAERLVGQHKLIEAADLLIQIDGSENTIADEAQVRAMKLMLEVGKTEPAVKLMDAFLDNYPDSDWRPNVLVWRGEFLQYTQGQPSAAIPYYEEVIVHHPGYLEIQDVRIRLRTLIGEGS